MAKEKIPPRQIKMDDGRVVEFPGKSRILRETVDYNGAKAVRFDFENGETRYRPIPGDAALVELYTLHGISQKFGDSMAGVEKLEDAIEGFDQLAHRLDTKGAAGWRAESEGGSGLSGASTLARALVKVTGQTIDVVREYLSGQTAQVKAALKLDPSVAQAIREVEAEAAAKAAAAGKKVEVVDVAAKLAEIGLVKAGTQPPAPAEPALM